MQSKDSPDFHSMSLSEWDSLSKNDQASIKKSPEYKAAAVKFRSLWESNPAVESSLTNAFASLREKLSFSASFKQLPDTEAKALSALVMHLSAAYYDPVVQSNEGVFKAVADVLAAFGDAGLSNDSAIDAPALFGRPARSETNRGNAQKPRLEGKEEARELGQRWFEDPSIYKNRSAFKRDILEKGWCKDIGTAGKWLAEFIESDQPSLIWIEKIIRKTGE